MFERESEFKDRPRSMTAIRSATSSDPYSWEFPVELPRIVFICTSVLIVSFLFVFFPLFYLLRSMRSSNFLYHSSRRTLFLLFFITVILEFPDDELHEAWIHQWRTATHIFTITATSGRITHYGLWICKQVDKSFRCVKDTHYKSFTYFRDSIYRWSRILRDSRQ